jgi:hypothetical protein
MKKIFALCAIVTMVFAVGASAFVGENSADLQVKHVKVTPAVQFANSLKKDVPDPNAVALDFPMDAYTAPTWATSSPSVFSIEEYTFAGGSLATVDHRTIFNNNATPVVRLAMLFAWQPCGSAVIFPPAPAMVGACPAGMFLTLPSGGIWYITVGISGFTAGTSWDWVWVTDTSGATCISIPGGALSGDVHGGDNNSGSFALYGGGDAGSRPLCFTVN